MKWMFIFLLPVSCLGYIPNAYDNDVTTNVDNHVLSLVSAHPEIIATNSEFISLLATNPFFINNLSTNKTLINNLAGNSNFVLNIALNQTFIDNLGTNTTLGSNLTYGVQHTMPMISSNVSVNIYDDLSSIPRTATTLTNTLGVTFNPTATAAPAWGINLAAGFVSYRLSGSVPVSFTQTNRIQWLTSVPTVVTNGVIAFSAWGFYGGYLTAAYKEICAY